MSTPCVLVVADPERIAELVAALSEPLTQGLADLLVSSGGDDTIDLFQARRPDAIVVTATLFTGDSRSLIEALRSSVPRAEIAIVLIGDDEHGPIRTALDAMDLGPDRFVARPLSAKALRFAVSTGVEAVRLVRNAEPVMPIEDDPTSSTRAALRARWEAIADSIGDGVIDEPIEPSEIEAPSLPPVMIHPRRSPQLPVDDQAAPSSWKAAATPPGEWMPTPSRGVMTAIPAEPTAADGLAGPVTTPSGGGGGGSGGMWPDPANSPWSTPAGAGPASAPWSEPRTLPQPPTPIVEPWNEEPSAPLREPTLILPDEPPPRPIATPAELSAISAPASNGPSGTAPWVPVERAPATAAAVVVDAGAGAAGSGPVAAAGTGAAATGTGAGTGAAAGTGTATAAEPAAPIVAAAPIPAATAGASATDSGSLARPRTLTPPRPADLTARMLRVAEAPALRTDASRPSDPALRPPNVEMGPPRAPGAEAPSRPSEPLIRRSSDPSWPPWRPPGEPVPRPTPREPIRTARPEQPLVPHARAKTESGPPAFPERAPARRAATEPPPATARADTEDNWPVPRPPAARDREDETASRVDPIVSRTSTKDLSSMLGEIDRTRYLEGHEEDSVVLAERGPDERWSEPVALSELRDSRRDVKPPPPELIDELGLDDLDDDLGADAAPAELSDLVAPVRGKTIVPVSDPELGLPPRRGATEPPRSADERPGGRDFARQLRAKMSQMAQRLFQGADAGPAPDLAPRHDHHTEIDLAALAEEPALGGGGVTEIEVRAAQRQAENPTTSPGSWDTHVRERGLADHGDIARGVSDAAMLLAKMFAHGSTGRIAFRRPDLEVEKIVFFDQGRPVFASSNEQGDRMGQLLVREGKITASQYERCQTHVAESGRRMGEILVDFGYLKRRELLPAVRRHVEDIVYSLFGWSTGQYHVTIEQTPSAERIRLSRHPASLILEGIRRKLDRTTLDKMVGPPSTVIEVPDRDKLGGIINLADLAPEERASLAAFDGQADLAQVARTAMIDVADVLPLAWGLCVLGLATARRADTEISDDSTALVGETDLAIDRERVRGRWQLVTEADYFALLGVRRDATGFEIRRAYQAARRDFAADCFPQDLRRELAQELEDIAHVLDEAFRVLRDDRLRVTYLSNLVE